jgi:hypothetical protein
MLTGHAGSKVPDPLPGIISSGEGSSNNFSILQYSHFGSLREVDEVRLTEAFKCSYRLLIFIQNIMFHPSGHRLYWVLLVQEVTERPNYFRRIGMGLVSSSLQQLSITYQDVKII